MKTRRNARGNDWTAEYARTNEDLQDLMEDGTNAAGYAEEKPDEVIAARGENKVNRAGGNKRSGRVARAGAGKAKNEKHMAESVEFKEVVQGFFEFIEELNKVGRNNKTNKVQRKNEIKQIRQTEEQKGHIKKVKYDAETTPAQPSEKFELEPHPAPNAASKNQNPLYRYKEEDTHAVKDLLINLKDKEPASAYGPGQTQAQEKPGRETEPSRGGNQPLPFMPQFPGATLPSFNAMSMKQPQQQPTKTPQQQQQQQQQASNYLGGYDFPNMSMDLIQRLRMQQNFGKDPLANYFMQSQPYGKGFMDPFKSNNDLISRQLLELLQPLGPTGVHGAASLFDNLPRDFPMMNPVEIAGGQRYPNQSIGLEVMRDPSAMNPRALEGKLGRAATHVAIAYFIYFKSLDPDTIAKSDKSKMDPTYNARMLKEKKHDPFGSDSLESYLLANMSKINTNNPFEYLTNQAALQRLLAQQGGLPDQLREAQLQRLQQEALLRSEELNQIRNPYQGKPDAKAEEEAKRRGNEHMETEGNRARQQQQQTKPATKTQPKPDEIIEINENSDGEESKQIVEQKSKPAEIKSQAQQPLAQAEKGKGEENQGIVSADDLVEEISALTGSGDGKGKKKNAGNNNVGNKKPEAEDGVKVEGQATEIQKIEDGNQEGGAVEVEESKVEKEKGEEKIEEKMEEEVKVPQEKAEVVEVEVEDKNETTGEGKMTEEPRTEEKQ